ncbi:MAG TPA: glycosyltransferase family 2 protein [Egibacteraceae bacterium]|nr:glycosyltransferase family 2 protein [Egibacteraceae bacterium]
MASTHTTPNLPRVAAILVVCDGEEWLGGVLATIVAQRYPRLDLVVVDNASRDGSPRVLARRVRPDRLITLPRRVGFGRAVAAALQHEAAADAELVLLLHDDLVLAPDALARLVRAMRQDPTLGIVGPKLREWSEDHRLQEVGMTTDRFGRAETALEPGEVDQGQHDVQRDTLYVSTAGMLLRTDLLRAVGGLDVRFPALRDDLDLCWRAWLAGYRVEVVPQAVGYHIAAASRFARPVGRGRAWEARYLAERHTLAALLKNYGALRLAWVLPVALLLAAGKTVAFLLSRRFGDAAAVVRAYGWNLGQLPRTLRRRRFIQSQRRVSDAELSGLFAPGLPRLRAYAEALGDWLAGGSSSALIEEAEPETEPEDALAARPVARTLRDHPAAWAGLLLLAAYLLGLLPLLGGGQVVGGEVAPWPESPREFLRAYASPWNGEPAASAAFASPAQALLGMLSFVGLGSAWLAQRLLVFGLGPLAWLLALRAGRLVTVRPAPRALGATLYVLSPVLLAALAQGHYGVLVAAALLPGLLLAAVRTVDPTMSLGRGWRAAALLALGLAVAIAAAPSLGPLLGLGWLAALAVAARGRRRHGPQPLVRAGVAGAAAVALLAPWLVGLAGNGWLEPSVAEGVGPYADGSAPTLWRMLAGVPQVLPGLAGPAGTVVALLHVAVVLSAVLLGLRARPAAVAGLVAVTGGSGAAAWTAARVDPRWLWEPALLLPASLSVAGLGVIGARYLRGALRQYSFGARQVTVVVATAVVAVGLVGGVLRLAGGPWDGLRRAPTLLPAFVAADEGLVGPYRVLVLAEEGGVVRWDVTGAGGPSMVGFGTVRSRALLGFVGAAVAAAAGGADLRAGAQLGLANVRYVVASDADRFEHLGWALERQPALEPLPSGGGRVYRVRSWLPRAVVVPPERGAALLAGGDPGDTSDLQRRGLRRASPGRYEGAADEPGLLVVSEASSSLWRASAGDAALQPRQLRGVNAFAKPASDGPVLAYAAGGGRHRAVVVLQVLLALGVVSLALRPPGFARRVPARPALRVLPGDLGAGSDEEVVVREPEVTP